MADKTKIQWTDATWNSITGCAVVSAGCTNCYAMKLAGTRMRNHPSRAGLTIDTKAGPVWNGEVRFNEGWLDQPLRWRRPRRIFVCAHGDLFYERVPVEWIDRVFAVMALAPQHIFQVLTKRPERMCDYLRDLGRQGIGSHNGMARIAAAAEPLGAEIVPADLRRRWPLPNVWLGTSCEDQATFDARWPFLRDTPAAVRFISFEPMLGPISIRAATPWTSNDPAVAKTFARDNSLHWAIVGNESGPHARTGHVDWIYSLIDQCRSAGVACFVKQLGARPQWNRDEGEFYLLDAKGGDPSEWPAGLRVRQMPELTA